MSERPLAELAQDEAERSGRSFEPAVAKKFLLFSGGFWRGSTRRTAWLLTALLALGLVMRLGVDVAVNRWNRWFFDALERRDAASAGVAVLAFAGLVCAVAAVGVIIVVMRERLQVRWREWFTARLLDRWLARHAFYRLGMAGTDVANPEYRISDDVRMATEPLVDFAIGLFTALLAFVTFIGILWSVGGSWRVDLGGAPVVIPAFMVLGALVYGTIASLLVPIVGRRLAPVAAAKNEAEARFRSQMIRLRENAEAIALAGGEAQARAGLDNTYGGLVRHWLALVRQHGRVTWVMNANTALIPVVPLVLAAPKYLAGELSLGQVMQLASAFAQVQVAMAWLADNYWRVAEWFASARRVIELTDAFDTPGAAEGTAPLRGPSGDAALHVAGLRLADGEGRPIVAQADLIAAPGERIHLDGEAGTGKSVLARAIAGLWPWGTGAVLLPQDARVAVLSSHPFVPDGTLEAALLFPQPIGSRTHQELAAALAAVGLEGQIPRLGHAARWEALLSTGDQQRLSVARMLLLRPDILVVDEAFSALGDAAQNALLSALDEGLADAVLIVVGARHGLPGRGIRRVVLTAGPAGSALAEAPAAPGLSLVFPDTSRRPPRPA
ncbi:ABC transporter ATP-binding protein/permease [Alsobacter sp. R-9]